MSDADDNLRLTKEAFHTTTSILQGQLLEFETLVTNLRTDKNDVEQRLHTTIELVEHERETYERQVMKLQQFLQQFELELTSAKIRASQLEKGLEEKEEECRRLKVTNERQREDMVGIGERHVWMGRAVEALMCVFILCVFLLFFAVSTI